MFTAARLLAAEGLKLRRSTALHFCWILPLLYLIIEFLVFERPALGLQSMPPSLSRTLDTGQLRMVGALWGGFFFPLVVALVPALLIRPEHRHRTWGHLHAMPVSRRGLFLVKLSYALLLSAFILILVGAGHWVERGLMARMNPLLRFPFHAREMVQVLGWLWLGSLPLLAFYTWVADRISSFSVSVVFGLTGLLLTVALSGAEVPQAWRRDLIPWVLPYFCAQQAVKAPEARQEQHRAAAPFQVKDRYMEDEIIIQLPSGRRGRIRSTTPMELVFPKPVPTPKRVLVVFSLALGFLIGTAGALDAGRNRS